MNQNIWSLIGFAAVALIVVGGLAFLSQHYTLDNIKSKTVGENICRDSRAWCWAVLAGKIMLQHWWIATISTA